TSGREHDGKRPAEGRTMARIRHIAYRADDVEAMVKFLVDGLGLERIQDRPTGAVDLSDGHINITILPSTRVGAAGGRTRTGVDHIGVTVEDQDGQRAAILGAGATESAQVNLGDAFYELKFHGPEGIIVDVGHWAGTEETPELEPVSATSNR